MVPLPVIVLPADSVYPPVTFRTLNVPPATLITSLAIDPLPDNSIVPLLIVVDPVYVFTPVNVWVNEPSLIRPTVPVPSWITPLKVASAVL